MHPLLIFAIFVSIAVGIIFLLKYLGRWKRVHNALDREAAIPKHHAKFKYKYTTPQGIRVWSIVKVPSVALQALDRGVSDMIARYSAVKPDWVNARRVNEYRVLFVKPTAINQVNEPGSPSIHVKGYQSAGTVIGCVSDSSCRPETYLVLPHQEDQNWSFLDYLSRSAFNEGEHYFEWHNCFPIFGYFATEGDVHPHYDNLPDIEYDCSKNGGPVK